MVANAVNALKQRRAEINSQIRTLEKEAKSIDKALAALGDAPEKPIVSELTAPAAAAAPAPKAKKGRRKMSKLGQLKIKLGSLNRYGKKEEAKKVQEEIDSLLGKKK